MRGDQLAQQFRPILLIEASPGGAYRRAFIDTCKFKIPPTISRKVAKFAKKIPFRFGSPTMILPRLGQGSFRVRATGTYWRRCAVTQARTLSALEAGHIKPFNESGPHKLSNGILLRSDIHRLFDTGYVTITPDYRFEVSRRVRDVYESGKGYYALNGRQLLLPAMEEFHPGREFISWRNKNRFLGVKPYRNTEWIRNETSGGTGFIVAPPGGAKKKNSGLASTPG